MMENGLFLAHELLRAALLVAPPVFVHVHVFRARA